MGQLQAGAAVPEISGIRIERPGEFSREDDEQILDDVAPAVASALGWQPPHQRG